MKSIINKLLAPCDPFAKFVTMDLKRLDKRQAGLGKDAISYVLTGAPETVISTVSVIGGGPDFLVCQGNHFTMDEDKPHRKRPYVIVDMDPFEVDPLVRYGEVLAAVFPYPPERAIGSADVPLHLRVLLTEAILGAVNPGNFWPQKKRDKPIKGLTPDRALELTIACGGTPAHLFELLFWGNTEYASIPTEIYRESVDLKPLIKAHPEGAIEGVLKCHAVGRQVFIEALSDWDLVDSTAFRGFVFSRVGDTSKKVREAAGFALQRLRAEDVEPLAVEELSSKTTAVRAGMVNLLIGIDTDTARGALKAHLRVEKTARIKTAISNALAISKTVQVLGEQADDATGYIAIDGTRIEIPPIRPLEDGPSVRITAEDRKVLRNVIAEANARIKEFNVSETAKKYKFTRPLISPKLEENMANFFKLEGPLDRNRDNALYLLTEHASAWSQDKLKGLAQKPSLSFALKSFGNLSYWNSGWINFFWANGIGEYLASETADLRAFDQLWQEMELEIELGRWDRRVQRKAIKGDVLRTLMPKDLYSMEDTLDIPHEALWPYIAENFAVLDHAFGLISNDDAELSSYGAVKCLEAMPKTPMRYFGVILDIATGERKLGKAEARNLLRDVLQVVDRLVPLLDDGRQATRAGAADWLGDRGEITSIPALKKRLKKEKSELVKAAILTALKKLDASIDDFVGSTALVREAEAGLKKANLSKLAWLNVDALPSVKFKSGKSVPKSVLTWWIFLAAKLKQPGGNALFEIYLDQLDPTNASDFSSYVLNSWVSYDTAQPTDAEANVYADANADQHHKDWLQWDKTFTREQAFAMLRNDVKSQYHNSGAATKGVLALASRMPPQTAVDKVRAFLRNHGSRTSQASALLELMANKGDPVSLQVVIAAATRLKQKGVQTLANDLVNAAAEKKNWTLNELADRTIPTAGMDDTGTLDLPCGPESKLFQATLSDDFIFVLKNQDGKPVKALSSGQDEVTKASKKQLSASRKELKQVVSMQIARLYEALCIERVWPLSDWLQDYKKHPIMGRLIQRVIWQGLDAKGTPIASFRPTLEGDFTTYDDENIDLSSFSGIRLAHGATMIDTDVQKWIGHLKDYEIASVFSQFGRKLMRIDQAQKDETKITDRKGWVTDAFAIRSAASKLGYERGAVEDGAWFTEYRKSFNGAGITAVVEFSGNFMPEENKSAALISLSFEQNSKRRQSAIKLVDVPPVLLSECWNDLHAMAPKGVYDANWEKTVQW